MTTFALHQISASVHHITSGRQKVGFVNKCPAGYVARIGKFCETASTAEAAFRLTAAKALGYESPVALAAHNQVVRQRNAAIRDQVRYAVGHALAGNFDAFDRLMGR